MLTILNDIGTTQATPIEHAQEECQQLIDHSATYYNVVTDLERVT